MTDLPSDEPPKGVSGRLNGAAAATATWQVGDWRLEAGTGELHRGGTSVRVEPKVAEVLIHLARRAGQVVSRDELLAAVWPGVLVGDDALTQAIIKLRKALGDEPRRPTYIETLSKRGYRLMVPVSRAAGLAADAAATPPADVAPARTLPPPAAAPAGPEALPPPAAAAQRLPGPVVASLGAVAAMVVLAMVAVAVALAYGGHRHWAWPIGASATPRGSADNLPVIAVLPLANHSGDRARDFFSDGVTDEIIHALGRYSGLRVISRNSVQQFKQRTASPQVVNDELGARYVVTGSVREADGRVRVAVELSDAQSARVLWSERFDGQGGEVFQIQDRIVHNIVGALAVKVTKLESDRAATRAPMRREAYDLVLLARSLEQQADRAANRKGRGLIAQARELAPDVAMVHVVDADLELQRANLGWMEDPAQGVALAERAVRRALSFDDPGAHARAHAQLARIHSLRREHALALAASEQARLLNPNDTYVAEARAETLLWNGRSQEAVALLESALRLDPAGRRSPVRHIIVGAYFVADRYPEALAACERALAEYPELPFLHVMHAALLAKVGRVDEARQAVAEVQRRQPNFPIAEFGNRFADPAVQDRFQAAFRQAGF